ncbi:MAG: Ig-like domain-containing protein, partial [Bacteroidales bacterium]|nr:Ig-like domain-containing protein [Bacteroidales bacterium]
MYNSFFSKLKVASAVIALFLAGCGDDEESVALQSINVLPSTVTLNPRQTEQLKAVAVPENATEVSFSWTSSNEAVATVSPTTGLVTAVAEGTATVNARSGNVKSKDVTVTVNLRVLESFTVTPNPLSLGLLDNPVQLVVTKTPADAGGSFTYDS